MKLSSYLFWDVDLEGLDYKLHARFVIERVLMRGTLDDWNQIRDHYGNEYIKKEVVQIRYLDKLTLNYCSSYFNIPKPSFKCSSIKQSFQTHWDY